MRTCIRETDSPPAPQPGEARAMELRYSFELQDFDFARIHDWLSHSYWSPGISREKVERGFRHSSLVIGCFAGAEQVAVARVLTDTTRFSYLSDVFVDSAFRGRGIAGEMVRRLLDHPDLREVECHYLFTHDAHPIYRREGFEVYPFPERLMFRRRGE